MCQYASRQPGSVTRARQGHHGYTHPEGLADRRMAVEWKGIQEDVNALKQVPEAAFRFTAARELDSLPRDPALAELLPQVLLSLRGQGMPVHEKSCPRCVAQD